jgi:hypothetical protein
MGYSGRGAIWKIAQIVIPKRGLVARGICCSRLAASRFLADKAGFGMTKRAFLRKLRHYRYSKGAWLYRFLIRSPYALVRGQP